MDTPIIINNKPVSNTQEKLTELLYSLYNNTKQTEITFEQFLFTVQNINAIISSTQIVVQNCKFTYKDEAVKIVES